MTFNILYSPESLDDLRSIYMYIAYELLAGDTAEKQVNRIREAVRKLDRFPEGRSQVNWEPWASLGMHFLPVDNYIVYYLVDKDSRSVSIVRIFYGGRDVEHIIRDGL